MDMEYVNKDLQPVKLRGALNWWLHDYKYNGKHKPYAIFYDGNVYKWGLTWEAPTNEEARIPIVILLRSNDKDSKAVFLPTKGQNVLEVGRTTNFKDHILVFLKEFVSAIQIH